MTALIAKILPITIDHQLTFARRIQNANFDQVHPAYKTDEILLCSGINTNTKRLDNRESSHTDVGLFGTVEFRQIRRLLPDMISAYFTQLGLRSASPEESLAFAAQHREELPGSPLISLRPLPLKRRGYLVIRQKDEAICLDIDWDSIISGELVHYRFLVASVQSFS